MKHRLLYIPIVFLLSLSFVDCAKKGSPTGGPRDTIAPIIVRSNPENYSTNFKGDEIEIRFNEYIKLKDVNKELIISPPMSYAPIISPLSTSKSLKIKIQDTLKPNTTYSFNFGNSIVDNNEENALEYFKYVFSTGTYIDSLKLKGKVKDAKLLTPEIPTTVMLYEVDETFSDSIIYSEKPTYITVTKDSTGTFEFTNLREGKYLLTALKEKNNDYIFQPANDKIGFVNDVINIPADTTYTLTLFKEIPDYKFVRPTQVGKNHIVFGYQGRANNLKINVLSKVPQDFEATSFKDEVKDSIHYWFKPALSLDSLVFRVANNTIVDTTTLRMRELYKDSLRISALQSGTIKLKDTFKLRANTPLVAIDTSKFEIRDKDSTLIEPSVVLNKNRNHAEVFFQKMEAQNYNIKLLPGALTDFFEHTNDTLFYNLKTKNASDYGSLSLKLENVKSYPLIIQLVDEKFTVVAQNYLTENNTVSFSEILPGTYYIRIIFDDNQNQRWDTGSFLNKLQPEKIIYYPKQLEIRANWSLNETFILK